MTDEGAMYKHMYHILCAAQSKAVDAIIAEDYDAAQPILQRALLEAENIYIFNHEDKDTAP